MLRGNALRALSAVLWLLPAAAFAQERGRTDGPEGSELGKGGYERPGGGRYSVAFNWGASLQDRDPLTGMEGPPLFVGATASYWTDDWFVLDASAAYLLNSGRILLLIGPKVRSGFYPISGFLGLQAGAIVQSGKPLHFGLSPSVGGDILLADRLILGLGYAMDIPLGRELPGHRVFMNIGYRF
ncbi:MAG: hypothetical protein HYZ28_02620 [Myxococcales bacterium]|nr:hypothetical protein [Myxococcales bacterium]